MTVSCKLLNDTICRFRLSAIVEPFNTVPKSLKSNYCLRISFSLNIEFEPPSINAAKPTYEKTQRTF